MEKTNWIEKIKKAINIAMNKGLRIDCYNYSESYEINIYESPEGSSFFARQSSIITIYLLSKNFLKLQTKHGQFLIDYHLTDREDLEIKSLILSIKEYNENMAVSEFEEFISSGKKEEITDINNLDDDD